MKIGIDYGPECQRPEDATLGHLLPRLSELGCVEAFAHESLPPGRRELPHEDGVLNDEFGTQSIGASVLKS
eukprot:4241986-Heterocapsa_arctica.AAC.1